MADEFDYVIVGSGAGGGPLAANLAAAGYTVCLLDAGRRPARTNANYNVPVFHPFATEDRDLAWYTYVRHYEDQRKQAADDKFQCTYVDGEGQYDPSTPGVPDPNSTETPEQPPPIRYPRWQPKNGVFYPRASTLGGCTAHYAMICVYPHNSDWDDIVERTGDWTWNSQNMRRYFQELERCTYRPVMKWLDRLLGWNPTRHGWDGWLTTGYPNPKLLLSGRQLFKLVKKSAIEALFGFRSGFLTTLKRSLVQIGDSNSWPVVQRNGVGLRLPALARDKVYRFGSREFVERIEAQSPDRLEVRTGVLVEQVLFHEKQDVEDPDEPWRARGVRYYEGHDLYEACAGYDPARELGEPREVLARREVVLAAGAFATPQILMLSGIGDHAYLREVNATQSGEGRRIDLKVHLPGVGRNLQDRYEVGLIQEMREDFSVLAGANFSADPRDPLYREWVRGKNGAYASNGAVLSIIKRSKAERPLPDLYIFGLIGPFRGYEPGYSLEIRKTHRSFTWAILKAHTRNHAGIVQLNRDDPLDPRRLPYVNFRYFSEGSDAELEEDLESVVEGVKFVRGMTRAAGDLIREETYPGLERVPTEDDEKIKEWVQYNAWGHHASCTCPIGLESEREGTGRHEGFMAVLDSKFRVFGTRGLRVVDASVFPKIPGFFIVLPLFMVSQKASEQIILDARAADRRASGQVGSHA